MNPGEGGGVVKGGGGVSERTDPDNNVQRKYQHITIPRY